MSIGAATIASGGQGEALSVRGEVIELVLDRAYAPGAPIEITIALADGPIAVRAKTAGSKRREDGRFDVRARLVSLRREDRARLGG